MRVRIYSLVVLAAVLGAGALALSLSPAASGRPAHRAAGRGSRATVIIRRTSYGIPHIWATTIAGAAEGYGYAFAQDNLCTMAEDYVTVDAQRSRYFGPDGSYEQRGNGVSVNNLDSDFFWQQIIDSKVIDHLLARPYPLGPYPAVKQALHGYVVGYNRYLASVGGANGVADPRCRGKAWVHPITDQDEYRRLYQLIELASGDVAIQGIAEAQPPTPSLLGTADKSDPLTTAAALKAALPQGGIGAIGSNAIAIGKGGARDHRHGVLLGNPHFPWIGPERFYQAQMTVPGVVNVEGASLFGVPIVLIGHTATMAWSHTVSTAFRFTPFQLTLVPGAPDEYLYDRQPQKMTSRTVTVQVLQGDGTLKPQSRTLYSSRFGPIFNSLEGVPLPWTPATAFALGDANADNFRVFNLFYDFDRARSAPQMLKILQKYDAIPWVNTIVADKQGNALYADIGAMPNVSNAQAQACDTTLGAATFKLLGLPVLDGSKSSCNWGTDRDAIEPGLFGASHMPYLFRSDYVTNSNDSYWLSNPHHPLTGFARIIGDEGTARSLRTRIGLILTAARVNGSDHKGPAGFTVRDMEKEDFSDVSYSGELTRDALVAMCRGDNGSAPTSSGTSVPTGNACDVLARWNLRENTNSHGDVLFNRFWAHADPGGLTGTSPFSDSFDPNDPVGTPHSLNTSSPTVQDALGDAIQDLNGAHIPLDAAPGDVQYVQAGGARIPIHGGPGDPNGELNAISAPFEAGQGFQPIVHGSSYIQAISWNNGPCPIGGTILTYSESENPLSPHHFDQTRLFSRKGWVPDRFCTRAVLADTKSTTVLERSR